MTDSITGIQPNKFSTIRLTFRALPCPADRHGDSTKRRVRALLKLALRSLSLRCVRIEDDNGECQPMVDIQGGQADE